MTHAIPIETIKKLEFVDITQDINEFIRDSDTEDGAIMIFTRHTTSGLTINENEAGLVSDMETVFEIIPDKSYLHDRIDNNARSHLQSMLLEHSIVLPISNFRLDLGTWQSVFFVELDGPRKRNVQVKIIGSSPKHI